MTEQTNKQKLAQPRPLTKEPYRISKKEAEERWIKDKLEDDEVYEALNHLHGRSKA
ncbi:MAG TPA: hypothetical protein VGJ08_03615 [Rhizomicrobium sp.]|jgi:hypothetical protein